ncbi:hypothetical protein CI238_08119 [Colletotrichum incanum]|uniref:Uncharacterized protein n=1 Tax=Colletotrichum incanum TaxID=1573173 RepID=A0A167EK36_COLIC|nr:hypothetical protein CI238_08119 [Colletotrichum incanum]
MHVNCQAASPGQRQASFRIWTLGYNFADLLSRLPPIKAWNDAEQSPAAARLRPRRLCNTSRVQDNNQLAEQQQHSNSVMRSDTFLQEAIKASTFNETNRVAPSARPSLPESGPGLAEQ